VLAQGLNIASGILLLPIILRYLSTEEVGLWFVFISLAGLAQLLELGFQPTIARNVAYIYAGAQQLNTDGYTANIENKPFNLALFQQLFVTSKKIYGYVALVALVISTLGGSAYLFTITPPTMSKPEIIITWLIYACGYIINFYYGYFNSFLQGRGDITASNKVVVASRTTMILLSCLLLAMGTGLIGLSIASLLSSAVSRILAGQLFWGKVHPENASLHKIHETSHNFLVPIIWHNASKLGWVTLGGFLITRANVLIATSLLGLVTAASYSLSFQILATLTSLSNVVLSLKMPLITTHQINNQHEKLLTVFGKSLAAGWSIYLLSMCMLLLFGNQILSIMGSKTLLLGTPLLATLSIILFLELNHSFCASYLTTLNEVPFVGAALISGVAIVTISIFAVSILQIGIWGMVLTQGIIQLAYNNWKWPQMAAKRMGYPFSTILATGFRELKGH
jgi:O-antigen/teichoic acid export membrane protein